VRAWPRRSCGEAAVDPEGSADLARLLGTEVLAGSFLAGGGPDRPHSLRDVHRSLFDALQEYGGLLGAPDDRGVSVARTNPTAIKTPTAVRTTRRIRILLVGCAAAAVTAPR